MPQNQLMRQAIDEFFPDRTVVGQLRKDLRRDADLGINIRDVGYFLAKWKIAPDEESLHRPAYAGLKSALEASMNRMYVDLPYRVSIRYSKERIICECLPQAFLFITYLTRTVLLKVQKRFALLVGFEKDPDEDWLAAVKISLFADRKEKGFTDYDDVEIYNGEALFIGYSDEIEFHGNEAYWTKENIRVKFGYGGPPRCL